MMATKLKATTKSHPGSGQGAVKPPPAITDGRLAAIAREGRNPRTGQELSERGAVAKALRTLRRSAVRQRLVDIALVVFLLLLGFLAGFTLKSCVTEAHARDFLIGTPVASQCTPGDTPTVEEWCAGIIERYGKDRGKEHSRETARAVVACAPLLDGHLSNRKAVCLLMACIWAESHFDPHAYGTSKDSGLMQLVPYWHEWRFAGGDWRDPMVNVRAGAGLMAEKLEESRGDVWLAVSRYNAGPGCDYVNPHARKVRAHFNKLLKLWDDVYPPGQASVADAEYMDRL